MEILTRKLAPVGRTFIGVAMIAFGVQQLLYLNFVTRVFPKMPAWIPAQPFIACVLGAFLIVAGAAIVFNIRARTAALLLGGVIFVSFVLFYVPWLLRNLSNGGIWTNSGKALALA